MNYEDLLIEYRALLIECRALWMEYKVLMVEYRGFVGGVYCCFGTFWKAAVTEASGFFQSGDK